MARYIGPVEKIERRFGVSLELKGERRLAGKCAINKRKYGPGQHGQNSSKISEYGLQLREKQKAKFIYGISERQFRLIFVEAHRIEGNTGENLIRLMEQRLDNVVYRMGFASTRRFARQLITHGHILVDNKRVDIPSCRILPGQVISLKDRTKNNAQIQRSRELNKQSAPLAWIEVDENNMSGIFSRFPDRSEVIIPVEERLIVELYSK